MDAERDRTVRPLVAAVFLVFFHGTMLSPLIPALAHELGVSVQQMGLVVPAYMLPYGCSTLVHGPLSDRLGRGRMLSGLLALFVVVSALMPFVHSLGTLLALRALSGICAGGVLPITLALVGDLYPYARLGRPMGWLFGAVAGGTAFGSVLGAGLNPVLGWRRELVVLVVLDALVAVAVFRHRAGFDTKPAARLGVGQVLHRYVALLRKPRALGTYGFVFTNGMFHSGIFAWLGYYLVQRYELGDAGIARTLVGYGLPGMLLGPSIGRLADRFGRGRLIPIGFALAAACALVLAPTLGIVVATLTITMLSVGFDMSHPLLAGVVASLDPEHRGQAMGFNAFAVFVGFGLGTLGFQVAMRAGLATALVGFGVVQLLLALASWRFFRAEVPAAALG